MFNAETMKYWRTVRGMSQSDLASAAGLSRPYISQIEKGTKTPSAPAIQDIAKALDINTQTLVDSRYTPVTHCPTCGKPL